MSHEMLSMTKILEDIHQSDGLVWNQQHPSSTVLETQSIQEKKSWNINFIYYHSVFNGHPWYYRIVIDMIWEEWRSSM